MTIDRRMLMGGGLAMTAGCTAAPDHPTTPDSPPPPPAQPRRVASLNPCLDVILVEVADRDQIAALSHFSRDAYGSTITEQARSLPFTWGTGEEIAALRPDLVLVGQFSSRPVQAALDRLRIPTSAFAVPATVAESLQQVREVARLLGHPERGEALVARIKGALAAAAPSADAPVLSALVFMPGGFVSAPGTLMDEMMRRTGFENAATRYGLTQSTNLPLEQLIADPPDVLLSGEPSRGAPSRAESVMQHPALSRVAADMQRAVFPERLLFCGGPVLIRTAAVLARAREQALTHRKGTNA